MDLSKIDLSKMDLSKMDLSKMNLSAMGLSSTDLSKVDFSKMGLSKLDLSKMDLSKMNITLPRVPPDDDVGHRRTVIPRSAWGALPPLETTPLPHPIRTVVFAYNTGQSPCTSQETCSKAMKEMQAVHMGKGLADIYYNFCVGGDGAMYEGRGWTSRHSKEATFLLRKLPLDDCLVIGVIGDGKADAEWKQPYEVIAPGMRLVNEAVKEGKIIQDHNTIEEHEPVKECVNPGC